MGKCFAVTQGSYSDYHVNRVFSTREGAERWMKENPVKDGWDGIEIEEFYFDDFTRSPVPGLEIRMRYLTGEITDIWDYRVNQRDLETIEIFKSVILAYQEKLLMTIFFDHKDREKAIKAANEKRMQMIAANINEPGSYFRESLIKEIK